MDLSEVQARVDDWIRRHGGYWDKFQILSRLTEELGEVSAALQRSSGLRPGFDPANANVAEELGDLLFTLAVLANACDVQLDQALLEVLRKYDARDSAAFGGKE